MKQWRTMLSMHVLHSWTQAILSHQPQFLNREDCVCSILMPTYCHLIKKKSQEIKCHIPSSDSFSCQRTYEILWNEDLLLQWNSGLVWGATKMLNCELWAHKCREPLGFLKSDLKLSHTKDMVWCPCQNDSVITWPSEMKFGIILEADKRDHQEFSGETDAGRTDVFLFQAPAMPPTT